jgi:hypothetical protein
VFTLICRQPSTTWAFVSDAAPKLTADDYIEIQQLYANYAHALDQGEGERFASTFVLDGEFTGGRGPGRGGEVRAPIKSQAAQPPPFARDRSTSEPNGELASSSPAR